MHHLDVTMVVPQRDGVNGELFAEINLHPLRAFLDLNCVVIERLLFAVGNLIQLTAERLDAAGNGFAEGDILDAFGGHERRARFVRKRFDVRAGWKLFGSAL
jgi:hypothetical protein